jgi:superfamily II RNA helicase
MAGRAGRRGLDTVGHVIHMNNIFDTPYVSMYKQILGGVPQRLQSKFHINYALILRLMKYCTTSNDQEQFISKSILYEEVQRDLQRQESEYNALRDELNGATTSSVQYNATPLETLEKYDALIEKSKYAKQKQRKKMERELNQLKDSTRTFERDYKHYCTNKEKLAQLDTMKETMHQTMEYISVSTENIFYDLATLGFIEEYNVHAASDEDEPPVVQSTFRLSEKGQYASMVQELHPLVFGDALQQKVFEHLDAKEIFATLASFIDIQVQEDYKNVVNNAQNANVYNAVETIKGLNDKYYTHELETYQSLQGDEYPINFDLNNQVFDWCNATNEEECKQIIQELAKKEITIGTFVKIILKLNNIVAELINVAQHTNDTPLMHKLSTIPEMTLKYVVTNQSLYV